jgi:hypothetical protein
MTEPLVGVYEVRRFTPLSTVVSSFPCQLLTPTVLLKEQHAPDYSRICPERLGGSF